MLVILEKTNGHSHGGYLSPSGIGYTSEDGNKKDRHSHVITLVPGEIDEQGNPISEPSWIVEAAGEKPHTHEISDIVRTEPKSKKRNDKEVVAEAMALAKEASSNEGDSIEKGRESYDYYTGDGQWDSRIKSALEASQRAAITVNQIGPRVDILCGTRDQNKTDLIFKPVENGDEQVADIANMVYKSIMNQNNFQREEGYVFRDLTVAGRGIKDVEIDFDKNIEGDIRIRWFPWDKVWCGPHEREDQEDMEYLIKYDNFSMAKLKSLYPKKAEDIQASFNAFDNMGGVDSDTHENIAGLAYRLDKNVSDYTIGGEPIVDVQRKEFKVFEIWQKEYRTVEGLILVEDNFVENGDGISEKDLNMLKRIPGIDVVKRKVCDMRKTETAGGILLSDEILDLPVNANTFHSVIGYAQKYRNKFIGKVEQVKDVQKTYNKLTSQTLDITNKMATYGHFYDSETFENQKTDADEFRRNAAKAGFLQKVKDISRVPVQAQGVKFPSELVNLKDVALQDLDSIMGIPARAKDFSGDLTAKMHMLTKRQSLVGNDFLFENSNMANKRLAKLVIAYVQALYTPERIMRIIGSQTQEDMNDLNDPNVINVTKEDIETMLNEEKLLDLDLVISESAHTDTMKELTFISLQEVMQTIGGDPTVIKHWVKNSPFPNKNQMLEEMAANNAAAAQSASDTNKSQTFASLPDSVKEQMAMNGIFSYEDLEAWRNQQAQASGGQQ